MRRRDFLAGAVAATATAMLDAARAAPVLDARNFGLTPARAARRNGWIEVDAAAFEANVDAVRALVGPARLCAVMKADAYGNSIALLMPSVIARRIEDVAITANDEARVARRLGYRGRLIRIRQATLEEMEDALPLGVEELIGNREAAERLHALWKKRHRRQRLAVHLALNAGGMSRNGIELAADHGRADAQALLALPGFQVQAAMTHFPSEEGADILAQLARFEADVAFLRGAGLGNAPLLRHTANSFAALQHPETRLDMVRVGGLLYGDPGSVRTDRFVPTMAIKSRVAAVNRYPAGQTVNYDRTFRLERESWLANIPLGYSDGYRRSLSHANRPEFPAEGRNRPEVLIGGRRYPLVGRVTMNTLMVDVTDGRDAVRLGDEVVLFGAQGPQRITQAEFEANSSAYGPELLAMLGAGLPRVLKA
ncbi:alanine racemase [Sandarakinorhabdus rubra]|uniref:alanine racemase n=1 Tax=Sandarakinorhabdus rubra TaxID=2672568 RepID=UPI0013DB0E18|nr:alanine racemase [Sandarakinorhabdus rubra]